MDNLTLSIILPAFNEAKNIERAVLTAKQYAESRHFADYEIVVVNDGSRDNTLSVLRELCRRERKLKVVSHEHNRGYGAALRSGFEVASMNTLFYMDGDGQFDICDMDRLLPYFGEWELVAGYRMKRADPTIRSLYAWLYSMYLKLLFGLGVKDVDCGFKLFSRRLLERVSPLRSSGALISAEFLMKAKRAGFPIKEVPIPHYPRRFGRSTGAQLKVILRMFKECWGLKMKCFSNTGPSHPNPLMDGRFSWKQNFVVLLVAIVFVTQLVFVDGLHGPGSTVALNYPWTGLAILALFLFIFNVRCDLRASHSPWTGQTLVWLVLFLFLSNFRWHGSDDLPTSLLPFSIWDHHTLTLDAYASWFAREQADNVVATHSHLVSFFPILGALLSLPVYALPAMRGVVPTDHILHQLEKISASLICAAAVYLLYRLFRRKLSDRWSFVLALAYALGTPIWGLCSQALWQYGASCLTVVASLWAMDRAEEQPRYWYACGAFSALMISARSINGIFFLGFLLISAVRGIRMLGHFLAGAVIPLLLLESYWIGVVGTGLPAEFGHQMGLFRSPPSLSAMSGILFSPGRGIFVFSPVVLFGVWGLAMSLLKSDGRERTVHVVMMLMLAARFLLLTSYQAWEGGFSFGSRYLIADTTLLFYFLPHVIPAISASRAWRVRWLWWGAVAASVLCQAIGAYGTWNWESLLRQTSVWNPRTYPPIYLLTSIRS